MSEQSNNAYVTRVCTLMCAVNVLTYAKGRL